MKYQHNLLFEFSQRSRIKLSPRTLDFNIKLSPSGNGRGISRLNSNMSYFQSCLTAAYAFLHRDCLPAESYPGDVVSRESCTRRRLQDN